MKRPRRLGVAPRRIALGDPASLETRLVREAQRDVAPPGASGRALAALGLATGAAGAALATKSAELAATKASVAKLATGATAANASATAASATAASAAAAAGATTAPAAKVLLGASLTTWLTGGIVAVAATVGIAALATDPFPPPSSTSTVEADATRPADVAPRAPMAPTTPSSPETDATGAAAPVGAPQASDVAPGRAAPPSPTPALVPVRAADDAHAGPDPAASSASASASPTASGPAPASSTLGREVALVDGARAALANGDREAALRLLDAYDREFPAGTLAPESARLRARATSAPGGPR